MQFGNNLFLKANKLLGLVNNLLFPIKCVKCGQPGDFLCDKCRHGLTLKQEDECPVCRQPNKNGVVCVSCTGRSELNFLWVLCEYDEIVKNIIWNIKYNFIEELVKAFDDKIIQYFAGKEKYENALFVPVPLHQRRHLERGFNQSHIICQRLISMTGGKIDADLLLRLKYTQAQAKLKANQRADNLKDAFGANTDALAFYPKGQLIILVDDVYTTGETMQQCARELKKEGFVNVGGLVLARGKRG